MLQYMDEKNDVYASVNSKGIVMKQTKSKGLKQVQFVVAVWDVFELQMEIELLAAME